MSHLEEVRQAVACSAQVQRHKRHLLLPLVLVQVLLPAHLGPWAVVQGWPFISSVGLQAVRLLSCNFRPAAAAGLPKKPNPPPLV